MRLMRWSPAAGSYDLDRVHDEFTRLFDGVAGGATPFNPAVDVAETKDGFVFHVDLPGVSPKDVKVSLLGDTLTIRGERTHEGGTANGGFRRSERVFGTFERSFRLGARVQNDAVKASFTNGVLQIDVPKADEAKVRDIEVQVG